MAITIDLPDEIRERLEKQAQLRGATVSEAIAQLLEEVETRRHDAFFDEMRAKGILLPKKPAPANPMPPFKRIEVQGKPVSECIIEERR
jgi:hypothetical protein